MATLAALTATPGQSAELKKPQMPRVIIMNDAGTAYRTYCAPERPTAADLGVMVDLFARGGVDTLTQCLHARWQAYYDSKVVEIAGDVSPEAVQPWHYGHYWAWLTTMRRLIERGDDPARVLVESCHRRHMTFLASFRLNDTHGIHPHEGQYGSFRRDHPEWCMGKSMDYAVPQVRQHILSVVQELVDRYDIDGIDFDFMRHPHYFRDGEVESNTPVMTDFIREVRAIMDKAGERRQRGMLFNVRVPMTIDACQKIGLDVRTWVKQGLVDMVCPAGFYWMPWLDMIRALPDWSELTEGTDCALYPTLGPFVSGYGVPYINSASQRGAAYSYYSHGADGIALYNTWLSDHKPNPYADYISAIDDMSRLSVLAAKPRRYHCYLGAPVPIKKGERKTIAFYLPEAPGTAHLPPALRFFGCNLTLDHRIEVDINGTKIDPESLRLDRNQVGGFSGTPSMPYGNLVTFPLANTAAKKGDNELGVTLIESNPAIRDLPEYIGVPASDGGIAVALVEALFGYRELPNPTRPGGMPHGRPGN